MNPLLKWAGGKRHIAPILRSHLPLHWDSGTYVEPFVGGAAFYLNLAPSRAVINDINKSLIDFYLRVRDDVDTLVSEIVIIEEKFNSLASDEDRKDFYLSIREDFNEKKDSGKSEAANFFTLNKLCFNGLYRENRNGQFNVPFGQKKAFPTVRTGDFVAFSEQLRNTKILCGQFQDAVSDSKKGDFVYFDPPYIPLNATSSFTSYSKAGFDISSQESLALIMMELAQRGVNAMASNSNTEKSLEIFGELNCHVIQAPRYVGATGTSRGSVEELLITNY